MRGSCGNGVGGLRGKFLVKIDLGELAMKTIHVARVVQQRELGHLLRGRIEAKERWNSI